MISLVKPAASFQVKAATADKSEAAHKSSPSKKDGNTFNIVRLVAALMVISCHSFPLLAKVDPTNMAEYQGDLAVWIFFVISGYLITGSYLHSNIFTFLCSRVLRLWPAFIVLTLLTVFVLGPAVTSFSLSRYFADGQAFDYLNNIQLTYIRYNLPGVFEHNFYPRAVNGSIWTIPLEALMYLGTATLGITGLVRLRGLVLLAWAGLFICGLPGIGSEQIDKLQPINWLPPLAVIKIPILCYCSGTLLYLYKEQLRPSMRLAALLLIAGALCWKYFGMYIGVAILLPLGILTFALRPTKINLFSKLGDYSYGIYLWAFPVQQLLVHFFPTLTYWPLFLSASLLSILCGAISWHLVEKPCLSLKKKLPKLSWCRPAKAI